MTLTYLYLDDSLLRYGFPDHPLTSERYKIFKSKLQSSSLLENPDLKIIKNYPCREDFLRYFHTEGYINFVKIKSQEGKGFLDYGDTPAYPGVFEVALRSVCATLDASKKAYREKACAVNLAGGWHHSRRDRASGFCVFNDIGVAINYLISEESLKRIYYIDIDAHHGDGVFYSYEEDEHVYIFDIHESGYYLYPGTGFEHEVGKGRAVGTKRNRTVPPGGGDNYLMKYIEEAYEWGLEISPDLIIMQGGMDGLSGDPLTHLQYSINGYLKAVSKVLELKSELDIGIVYLGGGGYQSEVQSSLWIKF